MANITDNMTDLKFYGDKLAEVEQQIEDCERAIKFDMMEQVVASDDCGEPEASLELTLRLQALRQHRSDLAATISNLVREVK